MPLEPEPLSRTDSTQSLATQSTYYADIDNVEDSIRHFDAGNLEAIQLDTEVFESSRSSTTLGKRSSQESEVNSSSVRSAKTWKAAVASPDGINPNNINGIDITAVHLTPEVRLLLPHILKLPWGVQWEFARLAKSIFRPERSVSVSTLSRLRGLCNNNAAPKVIQIADLLECGVPEMHPSWELNDEGRTSHLYGKESEVKNPWKELDIEEAILKVNPFGCLGCPSNEELPKILAAGASSPQWYGGKIHFAATLESTPDKRFQIRLEKPYLSSSCRFYRRFGSARFIRVAIPDSISYSTDGGSSLVKFFQRPFIFFTKVFRAFYSKDRAVFLFQTNETYTDGQISVSRPGSYVEELSLLDFLSFHNDIEVNYNQTATKWASRYALGLSNSIPAFKIKPENYHEIDEIYSPLYDPEKHGKPPSIMEMTDGCGLANAAFFKAIQKRVGLDHYPSAVQCRLKGMKGLLLLHPEYTNSTNEEPRVWIRPSQTKIKYTPQVEFIADPALFIVDLLRCSHMSSPACLSAEIIINMAENGVSYGSFAELMKEQLWKSIEKLTFWADTSVGRNIEDDCCLLRYNVQKSGSIPQTILARHNPGTARVHGFMADDSKQQAKGQYEDLEIDDEDSMGDIELESQSTAWWDDPISGCPSALHETVITLLDAGFSWNCTYLCHKLRQVVEMEISRHSNKFHFDVSQSCTAFIVPDPCGVLEPGEVHIKSSFCNLQNQNGDMTDIIQGDVLLTRHPCKVSTDVQKAVAVYKPELAQYTDVIVVSVKGHKVNGQILERHLASMTGGGDYDGDKMQAFWAPALVADFKPANPKYASAPSTVKECLSSDNISVPQVLQLIRPEDGYLHQIFHLQEYLLRGLVDTSLVGNYSKMWEHSLYQNGYNHQDTVYLAYMFCEILDGAKTGVTVKPEQYQQDKRKYGLNKSLQWKGTNGSLVYVPRAHHLHRFIMDYLKEKLEHEKDMCYQYLDRILPKYNKPGCPNPFDRDLAAPWKAAEAAWMNAKAKWEMLKAEVERGNLEKSSSTMEYWKSHALARREDLDRIADAIKMSSTRYRERVGKAFTTLPIERRQDILRQMSQLYESTPDADDMKIYNSPGSEQLRLVKASYAYVYEYERKRGSMSQFPFSVAMRDLTYLKAKATGGLKSACAYMAPTLHCHKAFAQSKQV